MIPTTPTPQAPSAEQTPVPEARFTTGQPAQTPMPQAPSAPVAPPMQQAAPPAGWYAAPYSAREVLPAQQQQAFRPTGPQRATVAIASVALLIPLLAIAIGTMTSLIQYVSAGVAITTGLIAVALVCVAVVAVNVAFNFDIMRQRH